MIAQRIQVSKLPLKGDPVNFTQWRGLTIARDIYRNEGLRGYYKGTGAFLLMYVICFPRCIFVTFCSCTSRALLCSGARMKSASAFSTA